MALEIVITDAGRAALVNAENTGTDPVEIAEVGISATAIAATAATEELDDEIKRISTLSGDVVTDDTIHLIVRDETNDVYEVRSIALYLEDGTLFGAYGQADPIVEKSAAALMLLAIDVRFADIDSALLEFGDSNFLNPPATETAQGVVELATEAETTTGTDEVRAVTPKGVFAALNARLGAAAPTAFIKTLLAAATAAAARTVLQLGSMSLQNANAVAITGGTATLSDIDCTGTIVANRLWFDDDNPSPVRDIGISWSPVGTWTEATDYFAAGGENGVGPTLSINAPSGTLVTNLAQRRLMRRATGFGWTWETHVSSTGTSPSVCGELDVFGNFHTVGYAQFDGTTTTASAANAFLNGSGRLYRSTSSIDYKDVIEAIDPARASAILDSLRPIRYRSRADADRSDWSWYGLVAEEVAAVEPRLVHFAYRPQHYEDVVVREETVLGKPDAKGRRKPLKRKHQVTERRLKAGAEPVPDGVQYERLVVLLLAERQAARAELAELRSAVVELKSRLDSAGL